METEKEFYVRWKGVTKGPFSREEILQSLAYGEIGLYHEVFQKDVEPKPLRFWVAYWKNADQPTAEGWTPTPAEAAQRLRLQRSYLWCGLSFLFPPLLGLALIQAQEIHARKKRAAQIRLAWILTLFGTLFWILLAAAW